MSEKFNDYKTKREDSVKASSIIMYGRIDSKSLDKGVVVGKSVGFARDLGNHPANILTPTYLAKAAQNLSDNITKMSYKIFDGKEFKKMGMGAFHGVAMGATEPAKMIIVEYNGGRKTQKPMSNIKIFVGRAPTQSGKSGVSNYIMAR